MQTAATGGAVGSDGSGRRAFAHRARTLPGVSWPSRVVRSIIRIARSIAHCLAVVLIDRAESLAARSSAPTWSTLVSPCRNRRSGASEDVTWAGRSDGSVAVVVTLSRIEPAPASGSIARGWVVRSAQEIGENDWVSQTEEFSRVIYRPMVSVVTGVVVLVLAAFLLFDTIRRGSGADAWALGAGLVLGSFIVYVPSIP